MATHYFYRKKIDPQKPAPYCGFKWVAVKPSVHTVKILARHKSFENYSDTLIRCIKPLGGGYGRGEIDENGQVVIYE